MAASYLERIFEHNHWANLRIIQVCSTLSDAQLDAEPQSATAGSIRSTLFHLVTAQQGYLRQLTLPLAERLEPVPDPQFAELRELQSSSAQALLALVRSDPLQAPIQTRDGYQVEPWVLVLQIINHATEHREQIKSMLTALGVTPPDIDGWDYGGVTHAFVPIGEGNHHA